jgi:hypothetical protein
MFEKRHEMKEMCAFTEEKNQVFLSASDPEGLRWVKVGSEFSDKMR